MVGKKLFPHMFVEGNLGLVEHSLLPGNILDYDLTYKYAFSGFSNSLTSRCQVNL